VISSVNLVRSEEDAEFDDVEIAAAVVAALDRGDPSSGSANTMERLATTGAGPLSGEVFHVGWRLYALELVLRIDLVVDERLLLFDVGIDEMSLWSDINEIIDRKKGVCGRRASELARAGSCTDVHVGVIRDSVT